MAMRQTSGLTVQGPPRRPTQAQTRTLRKITKILGVVDAAKRRAIRKEVWRLARDSVVFQTFERDAPTPGDVRKNIETVEFACQRLAAAISHIAGRETDEDTILVTMLANKNASVEELATKAEWLDAKGQPMKSRTHRVIEALKSDDLVKMKRKRWVLTAAGAKAANEIKSAGPAETVALFEIFQADVELHHENALDFDFSDLLVKLYCLTAATKRAKDNSASGKGRRPNTAFKMMVRGLREIVRREATFAATANWNDIEGTYTGPFVACVDQALELWGDMPNAPDRPDGVALGQAIKRA